MRVSLTESPTRCRQKTASRGFWPRTVSPCAPILEGNPFENVTPRSVGSPAPASLAANTPSFSFYPAPDPCPQVLSRPQAFACDGKPSAPSQVTPGVSGLGQRPLELGGGSSNPTMAERSREPGISWKRHHLSHGTRLEGGLLAGASPFIVTGI